jgi:hypothetical protein
MKIFTISVFLVTNVYCFGQDTKPLTLNSDAHYFDFWKGTWYALKEDNTLDTAAYFKVTQGVHAAAFEEEWQFFTPDGRLKSKAIRAWDKTNNKWGFVWVSDNGLYQVWDTKKIDGNWYLYKEFDVNGDKYFSRQAFIPQQDGTVLRVSEKSYDEIKWQLRFKQRLKRN